MAEQLDEEQLKALIAEEIANAESYALTELTPERERALRYYNGEVPDIPVVDGRSAYISRDVSNVVGWVLPDIMRVFTASDRIVDCLPEGPEDEESTDQAADYINFCFWRDNPGYQVMRDATWDSLVNKDGIVKQFWDIREEVAYSTYTGMTEEQISIILSDDNSDEVDENSSYYCRLEVAEKSKPYTVTIPVMIEPDDMPQTAPEQTGLVDMASNDHMPGIEEEQQALETPEAPEPSPEPMVMMQDEILYDIKVKRTTKKGKLVYRTVAPENFLTDPNAIDLIENWRFQGEKCVDVTRSDLIKMGFERDRVDAIPAFTSNSTATEDIARRNLISGQYETTETAMERVDLYECYIKVDINDDGIAEIVKVMYAGNSGGAEILSWEEWDDETPYDKIPCNPVPHRMASDSLADETMDIQKFKTAVGRQFFDNLYQVNMPTPIVNMLKIKNPDAVINPGIGVPILTDDINSITWNETPFIGDKALLGLNYLDDVLEMRTGVSRGAMSLDPDVLQNQTATASNNSRDARRSQVELMARDQAELGWKKVFRKSLKVMVKNQDRPRTIQLRDKWVDMDPRQWNTSMDIEVNIGLGTGSRDRDMMMLNNILTTQIADMDRLASSGFLDEAIDMLPKIIKTQVKIAEAAGIKSPEDFYPEISPDRLEQMKQEAKDRASQGDPKVEAQMQMKQADMQMKAEQTKADAQIKLQQQQADVELKRAQLAAEIQLKREQMAAEFQLKREQMAEELRLKREYGFVDAFNQTSKNLGAGVHMGGEPG